MYGLLDPRTGELRYVGKSTVGMKRPKRHCRPSGFQGNTHNHRWLRQMHEDGDVKPSILVLKECQSTDEALAQEIAIIAVFRQAGFNLTNLTDGGEGLTGYVKSRACIEKTRMSNMGHTVSQEVRDRISKALTGRKIPKHIVEKTRIKILGHVTSEETKRKISASHLGRKLSPEHIEKLKNSAKQTSRKHHRNESGQYVGKLSQTSPYASER